MQDIISIIGEIAPGIVAVAASWVAGKYGGDSSKGGLNSLASIIQQAANLSSSNITPNSAKKPLFVSENKLLELCGKFTGYKYHLTKGIRYPYSVPNSNVLVQRDATPPRKINCSNFAEALLARAWLEENPGKFTWDKQDHADMLIFDKKGAPFSSVTCPVRKKMAKEVLDSRDIVQPESWMIAQGWNESRTVGHCFLIWKVDDDDGNAKDDSAKILTLESNDEKSGIDGVGFKGIGKIVRKNIDRQDRLSPPDNWQNKNVPTWGDLKDAYPDMKLAKLNVTLNS